MHAAGAAVLAVLALGLLAGVARRARDAHRGSAAPSGARGGWGFFASRRRLREMRERHRLDTLRDFARHGHRMAEQAARDARRAPAAGPAPGGTAGPGSAPGGGFRFRRTVQATVIRLRPDTAGGDRAPGSGPDAPRPDPGPRPAASGPDAPRREAPGTAPPRPAPAPPRTAPQHAPAPPTGGSTPVTTPAVYGSAEDVISAVHRLQAQAAGGNIHAKRAWHAAAYEICSALAGSASAMSRHMTDEGRYGPEVTEHSAVAAMHLAAAASAMAEGESAVLTVMRTPAGELPGSGLTAPDRTELSETGTR